MSNCNLLNRWSTSVGIPVCSRAGLWSPVCTGKYVMMIMSLPGSHDTIQSIPEENNRINIVKTTLDSAEGDHKLQTYIVIPGKHHTHSRLSNVEQTAGIIEIGAGSECEAFSEVLSFVQHNCGKMEYLILSRDSTLVNASRLSQMLEKRGKTHSDQSRIWGTFC